MIDRDGYNGPIVFRCDDCDEGCETHCTDFPSALAKAKSRGWRVRKGDDGFAHHCPECAE